MPKTKEQKEQVLEILNEKIAKMKSAVMFNFLGVAVKDVNRLRDKCRAEGIDYLVAKKTILKKALSEKGIAPTNEQTLNGEVATLFSYEDEVAPAKIVASFLKELDKLKFVGGVFEGNYIDADKVTALSKIPSKKELLAKLVGCLSNPMSGLARVINAIKEEKEKQVA
ncbi:MAG: 50S ribosomal protein L10 [bacterium]